MGIYQLRPYLGQREMRDPFDAPRLFRNALVKLTIFQTGNKWIYSLKPPYLRMRYYETCITS